MRHDSLSDALIIIKNADHVGKNSAVVPASRLIGDVLKQLTEKGYLNNYEYEDNWQDCGTAAWPATGWDKDYTMNYMNPEVMSKPENAEAVAFFKKMAFSNTDQAKMLVRVGDDGLSVEEAVAEWKNSTDEWKAWLP